MAAASTLATEIRTGCCDQQPEGAPCTLSQCRRHKWPPACPLVPPPPPRWRRPLDQGAAARCRPFQAAVVLLAVSCAASAQRCRRKMATALQQRAGLRAATGSRRGQLRVQCTAAAPASRTPASTGAVSSCSPACSHGAPPIARGAPEARCLPRASGRGAGSRGRAGAASFRCRRSLLAGRCLPTACCCRCRTPAGQEGDDHDGEDPGQAL